MMLHLRTLGRLELDGGPDPSAQAVLQGPKRAALLVYLARAQPTGLKRRDILLALLWPEFDQARARHALRNTLHALRAALGTDLINSVGYESVGISEGLLTCDADAFEEALAAGRPDDAVALYGGDFLAGFFLADSSEFEQWLESERQRLRRAYHAALEHLAENATARDDMTGAVEWWRQLVAAEPYSGRLALRLMEALAAAGDRAGALQEGRRHTQLLEREFGAEPNPEIEALAERLRTEPAAIPAQNGQSAKVLAVRAVSEGRPIPPVVEVHHDPPKRRPGLARIVVLGLFGLLGVGAVVWQRRPAQPSLHPQRVVVAPFENGTRDPALDPIGAMAADWIIQGLSQTALVDVATATATLASSDRVQAATRANPGVDPVRALAEETGAGLVVTGAYYQQGDSLLFEARITDARRHTVVRILEPIVAPVQSPLVAIEILRQRMLAALAPLLDARLAAEARVSSQPPSYAAYRAYAAGMEPLIAGDWQGAIAHFQQATALDSTYLLPALLTAVSYANVGEFAIADSIGRVLDRSRARLGPYDRALLDMMQSWLGDDAAAAYPAAKRAAAIAPGSLPHVQWGIEALRLNRPREAISILNGIDPTRGEVRGWKPYWTALTDAYHLLGDYRDELKAAQRARDLFPDRPFWLWPEARALAGLGRPDEVQKIVTQRMAIVNLSPGMDDAGEFTYRVASALRAHGQAAAAQAVFGRAIDWYLARPPEEQARQRPELARAYYDAGRDQEAQALFEQLSAEAPEDLRYQAALGALAARRGDRAEAVRIASWLGAQDRPYLRGFQHYLQACITGELGEASETVAHLEQAFAQGRLFLVPAHSNVCFDPVRNDPSFQELLRPKG